MRVLSLASLLSLAVLAASLVALGAVNWPSADDYCNGVLVDKLGIHDALQWLYTQWSGRLVTGAILYGAVALLDVPSLRIVSVAMAASMLVVARQIAVFTLPADAHAGVSWTALGLGVLVVSLYPLLGQTVYWPTGGIVYWIPLLLLLHWLNGIRRLPLRSETAGGLAYWFVVSVLLGDTIELVVPIAVMYGLVMLRRGRNDATVRRGLLVRLAGVIAGAAVLLAAPGNLERARATPGSLEFVPGVLARSYADLLAQAAANGRAMLVVVAVLLVFAWALRASGAAHASADDGGPSRVDEVFALVIGGLASLVPLLAAPAQAAPRNDLYLLVAMLVAALVVAARAARGPHAPASTVIATLACVACIAATWRIVRDVPLASARRDEQLARHAYLSDPSRRGSDVVVRPLASPVPRTLHGVDITPEPGELVNWCVATHYGLRSIRLGSEPGT